MAGLYVTFEVATATRLSDVRDWMRYGGECECQHFGPLSYVWLSHDREDLFAPAEDPKTGVHLVTAGRLCWPTAELRRAETLPYVGGIANRVLLDRYLSRGADAVVPYNGAAVVLIWDPRTQQAHLWTDQFGYHPAFLYGLDAKAPTAFTTFPDAIRRDPETDKGSDEVSMAEFLNLWRTTPPNTYYKYVKHAGAACHWTWDLKSKKVECKTYWKPFESGFFGSLADASEALAAAISAAVQERTAMVSKSVFFVSGGADSRVMLFGAEDPSKVCGINIYEVEPTHESRISKALCERNGIQYVGTGRDNDYYPRMLPENVRWSGAMWSAEDTHYLGMRDLVMQQNPELVMTACTTDWVFKGYGIEKNYKKLGNKYLPIKEFLPERVDGFLPNYPRDLPAEFDAAIRERLQAWFEGCPRKLNCDEDYLRVEDRRIRPACYTVSVSGQMMYRVFPYDTFLADSRVAECYGKLPAKWKLNGDAWGRAAGIVCARASDIVDSNFGWRVNASTFTKLTAFAQGWISRRLQRLKPSRVQSTNAAAHPPTYASWPDLGWYATHSERLARFWNETSNEDRERLTQLWGSNPWAKPLDQWTNNGLEMFRVLTLLQHWRQAPQ